MPLRTENCIVVGTAGDKYESRNPISRYLVAGFDRAVAELAAIANPGSIVEIGAGEGHVTALLLAHTKADILATDISSAVLMEAEERLASSRVRYRTVNIENASRLEPCDLVVCCEVLEHLRAPAKALRTLRAIGARHYLFSVPREPIWRGLNILRGVYLADLGNSPGHLQHWSKAGFLRLIAEAFAPIVVRSPLPWTMVLCRPR
jgi:SAM-dependent methyltransferase